MRWISQHLYFLRFSASQNINHESSPSMPPADVMKEVINSEFVKFLGRHRDLMNQGEHNELRRRLILHLWDHRDERDNEE